MTDERQLRKTVTALFSDVVGSTSLGESHDPETYRRVLGRYFEEARVIVERHGGSVEKFIGDAVVALFGVPTAREDDALRALRAADELRTRLDSLNDALERAHGLRIAVRTGVNTGEVIVAETNIDGFRASGDTMNVAARLEQSAGAGEILIGSLTRELGGQAIEVEVVEPLELRGKADPVPAFRLVRVLPDTEAYERSGDAPLVGRTHELELLRDALRRARDESRCVTYTVVGPAGVGKSRLVREFLSGLDDEVRVLIGRCRAYGEGVTFLPLAEALEPVLGDDPRAAVLALLGDEERAESIANDVHALVRAGDADAGDSTDDASWAIRRLLEALARERPLVLLVDDIHWAEPSLLDLVEYVSSFSTGAPLLLLANARPDLLEEHPTWATPRENATVIVLQPLSEGESAELAAHLATTQLDAGQIGKLVDAADGNPLFLEQLVALNADSSGDLIVPPTIQALLAARIDRLELPERQVLECASVEGREFRRQSLVELLPESDRDAIDTHLLALARRQYIRAARRSGPDDAFVFVHALMRDAAYQSISKERRADLHLRLADHLETQERAAGEIVGHHLAEAYRYRRELEGEDDSTRALALRAAELLAGGGERALARGDDRAAARLLEQACDLVPIDVPLGRQVRIELGRALAGAGALERSEQVFQALRGPAREAGDLGLERRAELGLLSLRAQTDAHLPMSELLSASEAALPVFEEHDDERGLARAWFLIHWAKFRLGRCEESIQAAERVIEHSARAADTREQLRALGAIAMAMSFGSTAVAEGLRLCDELVEAFRGSAARGGIRTAQSRVPALDDRESSRKLESCAGARSRSTRSSAIQSRRSGSSWRSSASKSTPAGSTSRSASCARRTGGFGT